MALLCHFDDKTNRPLIIFPGLQGDYVRFNTGNREKLSYSQAEQARPAAWL